VFAPVPAAVNYLMGMLMELREAKTLPQRHQERAIVAVFKLNECDESVAHHTPFLVPAGVSADGVDWVLDHQDHPESDDVDKLVVE